jgi:adenine-specific DNA glycosylase
VAKLRKNYPVDFGEARRLPLIEHGFTHFRLAIQPLYCSVRKRPSGPQVIPHGIWLDVEDAVRAAVPAPVKTLLTGLLRDQLL